MKAFIYVGGSICEGKITEHPKADDLSIAADIGAKNAKLDGANVRCVGVAVGKFA